jgi:hypothetical protein
MLDLSRYIRPGDGVWWGQGGAEPEPLVNALLDQAGAIGPVRAFSGLTWNERLAGPLPANLVLLSYGGLGLLRKLSRRGGLEVVPCHYSSLPRMFARGLLPLITGAALGSAAMYGRLPEFPVEFRAASYTHDPVVLSRLRSLVSVNSAIEVDLLGQAGAELRGGAHIGAVGGQADFSRAASLTGARSVIALRSEYGGGESGGRSAIVAALYGGVVTTARSDVDAVVTEHGVAALTGCTVAERARRLLAVAAPHHREQLESSLARQDIPA